MEPNDDNHHQIDRLLAEWDGKETTSIAALGDRLHNQDRYVAELIRLMEVPFSQKGSTWLLKRYVEHAGTITASQATALFDLLPSFDHWESKLHMLQSLPHMPIPAESQAQVETFVRACLDDKKKFVRAWAYNGFYELSKRFPDYESEVNALLQKGLDEESGAVKARIRNILKEDFKQGKKQG